MFTTRPKTNPTIRITFSLLPENALNLDKFKILSSGEELNLSQTTNFRLFQTQKKSADENFRFDESDRMFSKRLENTVEKGDIARYEQFLLFRQCFQ